MYLAEIEINWQINFLCEKFEKNPYLYKDGEDDHRQGGGFKERLVG